MNCGSVYLRRIKNLTKKNTIKRFERSVKRNWGEIRINKENKKGASIPQKTKHQYPIKAI
jgi:hypothetical protein